MVQVKILAGEVDHLASFHQVVRLTLEAVLVASSTLWYVLCKRKGRRLTKLRVHILTGKKFGGIMALPDWTPDEIAYLSRGVSADFTLGPVATSGRPAAQVSYFLPSFLISFLISCWIQGRKF